MPEPYNKMSQYQLYAMKGSKKVLLPLRSVSVRTELRGATADTSVELTYYNPSETNPLECTYSFPLDKNTVLAKFEAIIDDRVVKTKIEEKQRAYERYSDAVAGGNTAVLAEKKKKEEVMAIKLGSLLPNQVATLKYQIISQIEIVGGFYGFKLPTAFYPDYKKHGIQDQNMYAYSFDYEVRILSENSHISNLILPKHAVITSQNDNKTDITVRSEQVHRTVDLYYRTSDMMIPQL